MLDPLLYLKSMWAAAIVSVLVVLAMAWLRRPVNSKWLNVVCVIAMSLGFAVGCDVLAVRWTWSPVKGLDRFLVIVVPMTLCVELVMGLEQGPRWFAWFLRVCLVGAIPRILLHGSVYLSGGDQYWTRTEVGTALVLGSLLLAVTWGLLVWLSHRSGGLSIPVALGLTIQCAGLTVMLAGYLKGGATAFPLAATIVATATAAKLMLLRAGTTARLSPTSIIGFGVIGLFGVLLIGRFFGRLSTEFSLVLLLTPLLCWTTELPFLRHRNSWVVGSLRLLIVAIPLVVVLTVAKRDFDRKMAPLLGSREATMSSFRHDELPDILSHCVHPNF